VIISKTREGEIWLDVKEIAALRGVSTNSVRKWAVSPNAPEITKVNRCTTLYKVKPHFTWELQEND